MAALHDLFLHNWASPPSMETAWQTEIIKAPNNIGEQRIGLLQRPQRVLNVAWSPSTRAEAARVYHMLARQANQSLYVPIGQDTIKVTASSSGGTINCAPANRRFLVGSLLVIYKMVEGRPAEPEIQSVAAVGATNLTLVGSLSQTFPAGSELAPVVLTEPALSPGALGLLTTFVGQVGASFVEIRNTAGIPALVAAGDAAGFPTHTDPSGAGSYPILTLEPDWSKIALGWTRDGFQEPVGFGLVTSLDGTRPRYSFQAGWLETDRASAWSLLKLFDSRRGRLLPFWHLHPTDFWNVLAVGSTFLDILPQGVFEDLEDFVDHVGIVQTDGTRVIRSVSSVADNGSSWRINLSASISLTLSQVTRACPAFFVRFAKDAIEESWITDEICQIQLDMVEVLAEADITITNIDNYIPSLV